MRRREALRPYRPPGAETTVVLAAPWRRFAAWAVDFVVVWVPLVGLIEVAGRGHSNAESLMIGAIIFLPAIAILPAYYALMQGGRRGQTLGETALGIAVRDARTLEPIGFWRASLRAYFTAVLWLLVYVPALLDAAWALFSSRSQTWHDPRRKEHRRRGRAAPQAGCESCIDPIGLGVGSRESARLPPRAQERMSMPSREPESAHGWKLAAAGAVCGIAAGAIARLEGSSLFSSVAGGVAVTAAFGFLWLDLKRRESGKARRDSEPLSLRSSLLRSMILPAFLLAGAIYFGSVTMALIGLALAASWIAFLLWTRDRSAR
jgi:uncharacterized RDD family membrane protein YckC